MEPRPKLSCITAPARDENGSAVGWQDAESNQATIGASYRDATGSRWPPASASDGLGNRRIDVELRYDVLDENGTVGCHSEPPLLADQLVGRPVESVGVPGSVQ